MNSGSLLWVPDDIRCAGTLNLATHRQQTRRIRLECCLALCSPIPKRPGKLTLSAAVYAAEIALPSLTLRFISRLACSNHQEAFSITR
jgi:hypothetical protein